MRCSLCETDLAGAKGSLIRVVFLSVNKRFRVFCYPCIPIEKEKPCENLFRQFCCVFLLCPPFLRKSNPPPVRSATSTSAATSEQRESCFARLKKCPKRITTSSPSIRYELMERSSDISPMPSIFSAPLPPARKTLV